MSREKKSSYRLNGRKYRSDDDLTIISVGDKRLERKSWINALAEQLVHLPISGYDGSSHKDKLTKSYSKG